MIKKTKLQAYNSPTFLAYALIAPAAIYILCIVAWPLIEKSNYDLWYKNMRKHYSEDKFFAM